MSREHGSRSRAHVRCLSDCGESLQRRYFLPTFLPTPSRTEVSVQSSTLTSTNSKALGQDMAERRESCRGQHREPLNILPSMVVTVVHPPLSDFPVHAMCIWPTDVVASVQMMCDVNRHSCHLRLQRAGRFQRNKRDMAIANESRSTSCSCWSSLEVGYLYAIS